MLSLGGYHCLITPARGRKKYRCRIPIHRGLEKWSSWRTVHSSQRAARLGCSPPAASLQTLAPLRPRPLLPPLDVYVLLAPTWPPSSSAHCCSSLQPPSCRHAGAATDLSQRKHLPRPEPGLGISIAESLASGDRALSVLPHDLVA